MSAGRARVRAGRLARTGLHSLPVPAQQWARTTVRRLRLRGRRRDTPAHSAPLVSIVLPVFGVEDYLAACLDSILGQTYPHLQVVAVDDGSPDDSIRILRERAGGDPRLQIVRQANAGLGAARNVGVAHAAGRYLMFVDSDDVLPLDAVAGYVQTLRSTGSDFAVGGYQRIRDLAPFPAAPWVRAAHQTVRRETTLTEFPAIQVNAVAWSKMYRRRFWDDEGLTFPVGVLYEDQAVSARAYARARRFDVLSGVSYQWRVREDSSSISQQDLRVADLTARFVAAFASLDELDLVGARSARDSRLVQLLSNDFQLSIRASQHAEPTFFDVLRTGLDRLRGETADLVWQQLPPQHRVAVRLVTEGRREDLLDFISLQNSHLKHSPSVVVDGQAYVQFSRPSVGVEPHDPLLALTEQQTAPVTGVQRLFWRADRQCEIRGWVYLDNVDLSTTQPEISLLFTDLVHPDRPALELTTVGAPDPEVTARSKHQHADYENGVFHTTFDPAALTAHTDAGRWSVGVRITAHGLTRTGALRGVQHTGSAGHLAGRVVDGGQVEFREGSGGDLNLTLLQPLCVLVGAVLRGRTLAVVVRPTLGFLPARLEVRNDVTGVRVTTDMAPADAMSSATVMLPVPGWGDDDPPGRHPWTVRVVGADGRRGPVAVADDIAEAATTAGLRLRMTQYGNLGLVEDRRTLIVDCMQSVGGDRLRLGGRAFGFGDDHRPLELSVRSPRGTSLSLLTVGADGTFAGTVDLAADPWGFGSRPLASDLYHFTARAVDERAAAGLDGRASDLADVRADYTVIAALPVAVSSPVFRAEVQLAGNDRLRLHVEPPLSDGERGARPQRKLRQQVAGGRSSPAFEPGAVLFRSYYGEICGCNPRAVHEELRRRGTGHTLYWAVRDHSVVVPDGGVPVVYESAEWYRLLQEAEFYLDNMHQPIYHRKPAHQVQVQSFHGYPFKAMGLTHWKHQRRDLAHVRSYLERAADWDFLVSPATYATELLRTEFGFPNEMLAIGYPRNDVLVGPTADRIRDRVRQRLGIGPAQTAVLYAPTFRDQLAQNDFRAAMTDFLDVAELATTLGEGYVVLVRGHAFHARVAARVGAGVNLVDVTDYPDINDLCLASDCAVLDYSSLRFDYALTGKPMVFLVPDLAQYVTSSRGALFAFEPTAPGPLVRTTAEVAEVLGDLDAVRSGYAAAYAEFRRDFLDLDDGQAAARLVDRVFMRGR